MPKLVIVLDLLAGLLIATNYLMSKGTLKRIDGWLRKELPHRGQMRDPLHRRSLRLSIALASLVFVGIIVWAILQDVRNSTTAQQLATSTVMYLLGALVGMAGLVLLVWALRQLLHWANRFIGILGRVYLMQAIWVTSVVVCFLAILGMRKVTGALIPFLVTFALGNLLLGLWMLAVPYVQRYLTTLQGGALARIGLVIFVISKLIHLAS